MRIKWEIHFHNRDMGLYLHDIYNKLLLHYHPQGRSETLHLIYQSSGLSSRPNMKYHSNYHQVN